MSTQKTITGLERLLTEKSCQDSIKGNIAYLCHSASITSAFELGVLALKKLFGQRLIKLFGPQHGFVTDVQDNMAETNHYTHPFLNIPIYSLYSETRIPTDDMLAGIDTLIVDLQDVGTRVYTYISTLALLMEKCVDKNIEIVILDRPNPAGGELIEGTILEENFKSFVGLYPIPQRHGLTMGEVALFGQKILNVDVHLRVIEMKNWKRSFLFKDTQLPWVNPSPNLSTMDSALTFVGTVLFEGTNISEGRGTTRALEIVGHPLIEPFSFCERVKKVALSEGMEDNFVLRPTIFLPTFQKHMGKNCGGAHIHATHPQTFRSWHLGQILCREFARELGSEFQFHQKPYEYEHHRLAIDLINGNDKIRNWVLTNGSLDELKSLEQKNYDKYLNQREKILLYN